jgi:dUTPase
VAEQVTEAAGARVAVAQDITLTPGSRSEIWTGERVTLPVFVILK